MSYICIITDSSFNPLRCAIDKHHGELDAFVEKYREFYPTPVLIRSYKTQEPAVHKQKLFELLSKYRMKKSYLFDIDPDTLCTMTDHYFEHPEAYE